MELDKEPFSAPAYHPKEKVIRPALWLPHHFGVHEMGVKFDTVGPVYRGLDCTVPTDTVFTPLCKVSEYPPSKRH